MLIYQDVILSRRRTYQQYEYCHGNFNIHKIYTSQIKKNKLKISKYFVHFLCKVQGACVPRWIIYIYNYIWIIIIIIIIDELLLYNNNNSNKYFKWDELKIIHSVQLKQSNRCKNYDSNYVDCRSKNYCTSLLEYLIYVDHILLIMLILYI